MHRTLAFCPGPARKKINVSLHMYDKRRAYCPIYCDKTSRLNCAIHILLISPHIFLFLIFIIRLFYMSKNLGLCKFFCCSKDQEFSINQKKSNEFKRELNFKSFYFCVVFFISSLILIQAAALTIGKLQKIIHVPFSSQGFFYLVDTSHHVSYI